jgi:hypothetical protein
MSDDTRRDFLGEIFPEEIIYNLQRPLLHLPPQIRPIFMQTVSHLRFTSCPLGSVPIGYNHPL